MNDYPLNWRRVSRAGYGYVTLVPCREIKRTEKTVLIAALRRDGTEALRRVKPDNIFAARNSS